MALSSFVGDTLKAQPSWLLFFAALGILSLTKFSISFLKYFYVFFLRPAKNLHSYGSWAVITGSTDGIGKAFAFDLARKGINLVLLGRNHSKLQQVLTEISSAAPSVELKTVVADLCDDIKGGVDKLRETINGLDVGLLINNAGLAEPFASFFDEVSVETWMKIVKVNLEGLTEITRAIVPLMLRNGKGAIVNIGSGCCVAIPSYPLFSVYSGTKQYINQLSKYLYWEYKDKGIDVQCQAPLYVRTKMISPARDVKWSSILFEPLPKKYTRSAMNAIGYEPLCIPYLPHFLQWCWFSIYSDFINDHIFLRDAIKMGKKLKVVE